MKQLSGRRIVLTGASRGINYNAGVHDEPLDTLEQNLVTNLLGAHWLTLGGPRAPGEPRDGAIRLLEVLTKPFDVTGGFWYGADAIPF